MPGEPGLTQPDTSRGERGNHISGFWWVCRIGETVPGRQVTEG